MDWMFAVKDCTGRLIHLSKQQWKHIARKHAAVLPYFEEIKLTIKHPIIMKQTFDDTALYANYFKERHASERFLVVAVKYLNNHGIIITAYFTKQSP